MTLRREISEHISRLELIDNHAHGCWLTPSHERRFENALIEANTEPLTDAESGFDTQLGFAIRALCSPVLGLAPHTDPQTYLRARESRTERELAHVFLRSAGVTDWLVDTGLPDLAGMAEMAELADGRAHEVVRIEEVAEQVALASGDYAAAFRENLWARAASAVATKTILAYRGGFDRDLSEPSERDVAIAAQRWRGAGGGRLTDPVLLRFGLHEALRLGKPVQIHVGLGDRDCDLHRTNPMHLLDLLRSCVDVPIVLLHCYPYEREAGYLAQAFSNVYLDQGLSINHLGARAAEFIRRTMELAPFRKIMYSSDGVGPPELHYLGARLWRDGIAEVLAGFVERSLWSLPDAVRVAGLIGRDTALRVYQLDRQPSPAA